MRRIVLTYIFLSVIGIWGAMAQNTLNPMNNRDRFGNQIDPNTQPDNLEDSTNTEIQSLPPKLYMWKLSETLGVGKEGAGLLVVVLHRALLDELALVVELAEELRSGLGVG